MKKYFLIGVFLIIALMIYSMFSEKNIHDLEGGFKEVAYTRNENNTGPVVRIYAFTVEDTLWNNISQHAELLPHTKYGTTEAYYFLAKGKYPSEISLNEKRFDPQFKKYCIAKSVTDGQGRTTLNRFPFRE
ncbi:hypothetical protein GCM10011506_37510 [Marivirga lumbricoides]|uniref:GyrI-like small molecule binding domain-containing protein n=1 Tax=Marivirga lumbricoides TaxID=1046115 RepID=A0ABQ1MWT9_9BACT|nr:hypothetical protein GCM10011506_37510 [Marivirga lumbricoides]